VRFIPNHELRPKSLKIIKFFKYSERISSKGIPPHQRIFLYSFVSNIIRPKRIKIYQRRWNRLLVMAIKNRLKKNKKRIFLPFVRRYWYKNIVEIVRRRVMG
jgi:hypothetical protein